MDQRDVAIDSPLPNTNWAVIVAALSAELLPRCVRLLETRVLRVCGRWSFAMYLLHEPLIVVVYVLSLRHGWPLLLGSELPIQLLFTTVCIGATVAVAAVSWRFYEQPILRLKRFFPMGQERKKTATVTVPAEDVSAAA